MAKHAAAQNLIDRIIANDVSKVEEFLSLGDSLLWRQLIRYEFDIESFKSPELAKLVLLPKLQAYEIKTLSSFHLTALLGATDILISLMEKDVPVDIPSISGTTALHLACFSGQMDLVQLLIEVYKADIHRVDRYGWSALHYACTEGHLPIVETLVGHGIDVNERDQDGTTPAFRAQVNGHQHIIKFLLLHGSDDDQLNVTDSSDTQRRAQKVADLYTKVNKPPKPKATAAEGEFDNSNFLEGLPNGNASESKPAADMFVSAPAELNRCISEDTTLTGYSTGPKPLKRGNRQSVGGMSRSKTLPSKYKNTPPPCPEKRETIRRIIQKELEMSFGSESDYERPINSKAGNDSSIWEEEVFKDVGVKTLTGLMREEFEKYKQELVSIPMDPPPPPPPAVKSGDDSQYEDLYASLTNLPDAPSSASPDPLEDPADAPPLPPRNPSMARHRGSVGREEEGKPQGRHLTLAPQHSNNPALTESFTRLAPLLGKNWKKLAHMLPLADKPNKVNERISAIEKQTPKSVSDQALRALSEWRVQKGRDANVDALIIALRKCNLDNVIPEVEKVTQEFTA